MDKKTTGIFIAELRKEKHLTQKQLADILLITDKAVSKWEQGISAPDTSLLLQLSDILEVSVVELLNGHRIDTATADDIESALTSSIKNYQAEKNRFKRRYIITAMISILLTILLIIGFLWANTQISQYTQINKHLTFIETKITIDELNDTLDNFNGTMDVKEYVSFCEDTLSLGSILYEYPESVSENIFQIPLRDAYRAAGDSFLRMYHISYSHIDDNIVYFDVTQEEDFKTLLETAIANYQTLLNMLDEMWQRYEKNPIIRIYLYLS